MAGGQRKQIKIHSTVPDGSTLNSLCPVYLFPPNCVCATLMARSDLSSYEQTVRSVFNSGAFFKGADILKKNFYQLLCVLFFMVTMMSEIITMQEYMLKGVFGEI